MHEYKKCEFDKILDDMFYDTTREDNVLRKPCYTKLKGNGYAIGSCFKFSGKYKNGNPGSSHDYYEGYESAELIERKRVDFVKVLVSFNEIVLVNKNDVRYIDEKKNDTL